MIKLNEYNNNLITVKFISSTKRKSYAFNWRVSIIDWRVQNYYIFLMWSWWSYKYLLTFTVNWNHRDQITFTVWWALSLHSIFISSQGKFVKIFRNESAQHWLAGGIWELNLSRSPSRSWVNVLWGFRRWFCLLSCP